ncbi:MAG: prepilin-type N-terminal cleavage/methylation domain-containing protein [Puniceicoccales bacterium]|nr:prepilin-type N-terminal cleavage/methylation domain-containing protein [Puniceicoccales bacterium]
MDISKKNRKSGMTLVEVLVVILLIGVLTTAMVRSLGGTQEAGRQAAAKLFLTSPLKSIILAYQTSKGKLPQNTADLDNANLTDADTWTTPWGLKNGYELDINNGNIRMWCAYGATTITFDAADGTNGCAFEMIPSGQIKEKAYGGAATKAQPGGSNQ